MRKTLMIPVWICLIAFSSCDPESRKNVSDALKNLEKQKQKVATHQQALSSSLSRKTETMIDRCSASVYFSPTYHPDDDKLIPSEFGLALERNPQTNSTDWSNYMSVDGHSWIRWWCNSTTGNFFDPGTWIITEALIAVKVSNDGTVSPGDGNLSIDSESEGWTPERCRCASEKTKAIRARLGPDRLIEIECWE